MAERYERFNNRRTEFSSNHDRVTEPLTYQKRHTPPPWNFPVNNDDWLSRSGLPNPLNARFSSRSTSENARRQVSFISSLNLPQASSSSTSSLTCPYGDVWVTMVLHPARESEELIFFQSGQCFRHHITFGSKKRACTWEWFDCLAEVAQYPSASWQNATDQREQKCTDPCKGVPNPHTEAVIFFHPADIYIRLCYRERSLFKIDHFTKPKVLILTFLMTFSLTFKIV